MSNRHQQLITRRTSTIFVTLATTAVLIVLLSCDSRFITFPRASVVFVVDAHPGCGSESRSQHELEAIQSQMNAFKERNQRSSSQNCKQCIRVETYVTVIQSNRTREEINVDQDLINVQMDYLNNAFADTPFYFDTKGKNSTFVTDDLFSLWWYETREEKQQWGQTFRRKGDYSTLNVYFGGMYDLSYGLFPTDEWYRSPRDGVLVNIMTLPGGFAGANGATLVHEIGHWLGLEHVFKQFSDKPCDINDPNDFVDDTPQMGVAKYGQCPTNASDPLHDTCPLLPGVDPIHNYMDYSSEECVYEFTPGQLERMYYHWSLFRKKEESCTSGHALLEIEVLPDGRPWDISWELVSKDEEVQMRFIPSYDDEPLRPDGTVYRYEYIDYLLDIQDICVDDSKEYVFTMFDANGDGLAEANATAGYYKISYDGNEVRSRSVNYGSLEVTTFRGSTPRTPAPIAPPSPPPTIPPSPPPTMLPTEIPSVLPSGVPSMRPSLVPSLLPTVVPSLNPTSVPSVTPSSVPTSAPTVLPTVTAKPSFTTSPEDVPTLAPLDSPSAAPTTALNPAPIMKPNSSVPPVGVALSPAAKPTEDSTSDPANDVPSPTFDPSVPPNRTTPEVSSVSESSQSGGLKNGTSSIMVLCHVVFLCWFTFG